MSDDKDSESSADPKRQRTERLAGRRTAEERLLEQQRALQRTVVVLPPNVAKWMSAYDRIGRDAARTRAALGAPDIHVLRTHAALMPSLTPAAAMTEIGRQQRELAEGYRRIQGDAAARLAAYNSVIVAAAAEPAAQRRRADERIAALHRLLAGHENALSGAAAAMAAVEAQNRARLAGLSHADVSVNVAAEIAIIQHSEPCPATRGAPRRRGTASATCADSSPLDARIEWRHGVW